VAERHGACASLGRRDARTLPAVARDARAPHDGGPSARRAAGTPRSASVDAILRRAPGGLRARTPYRR
jgi:hypothetical protein